MIEIDVASRLDLPRQTRLLPDTLSIEQVEALLEAAGPAHAGPGAARALRDRAFVELLYAAGLRVSEALGLDRDDLALDAGTVRVIGKGDKERVVPVGEVALDWLRRYLDEVRPAWLEAGRDRLDLRRGGPVFLTERGARLAFHQERHHAVVAGPRGPHHTLAAIDRERL